MFGCAVELGDELLLFLEVEDTDKVAGRCGSRGEYVSWFGETISSRWTVKPPRYR